jgi:hypothetical protein
MILRMPESKFPEESQVFRPASNFAPSDCMFVSNDKNPKHKAVFCVHKLMLAIRSPYFAAILEGSEAGDEPVELPVCGKGLRLFFKALYSHHPHSLVTGANVVTLCSLANRFSCAELVKATSDIARRLVKKAKLSGGPAPTLPALAKLAQDISSKTLLDAVLVKVISTVDARVLPTALGRGCPQHPGEPLPCYFKCPAAPQRTGEDNLDAAGKGLLSQLSPKTLVRLIDSLIKARIS